jgi:integrase
VRVLNDGRKRKHPAQLLVGGKVKESFETEAQALTAARELANTEREFGREVRAFDPREWRRYIEAKRQYFGGKEPDWKTLMIRPAADSLFLPDAVAKYIDLRAGDGLAAGTTYQLKKKLGRLALAFAGRRLHEIDAAALRDWLKALPFAPWTIKDHLKVAATFWGYARREKWCLEDPTEAVTAPKVPVDEVNLLTLAEVKKLFLSNRGQPVVGRLALEAFGGLRFSSAARLVAGDIKWADKGLELPGKKHKSGRRQYLDGLPANLWKWLKLAPAACWDMTERQYLNEKAAAFVRAGLDKKPAGDRRNCLRHSFASYHVAAFRDAGKTAVLMQHTNQVTLYRFYKGRATSADGLAYFKI